MAPQHLPASSSQGRTATALSSETHAPNSGAPRAALSWLRLLSLSTEKGQVPFGASVGVVSFFTTLGTAGGEGGDKNTVFECTFQQAAPTKYQTGDGAPRFSV